MAARKNAGQEDTDAVADAADAEDVRDEQNGAAATKTASTPARARGDTTVPGGRYRVNGRLVNASGQPISE